MPEIAYELQLDDQGLGWFRFRIWTERGRVVTFTAQYETMLDGKLVPVVRYDNAHGFAHRDLLDRRGQVVQKTPLADILTPPEAQKLGERDIRLNWRKYRRAFFGATT